MNAPFHNQQIVRVNFGRHKKESPVAPPEMRERWSLKRWLFFIALVLAAHVAAIFIFTERKFPVPRTAMNVPHFQLADDSAEIFALENPTLFAQPRAGDLASAGLQIPDVNPPAFRWSESPHFLPLPAQTLVAAFHQFMQTNAPRKTSFNFKPQPKFAAPTVSLQPVFAAHSTLQMEGELAQRKLVGETALPDWPYADVIAPSRVQIVVDENGNVISAAALPLNSPLKNEIRYDAADSRALEIARGLRFTPAPQLIVGSVIFNWRTVPPPETNSVTGS